MQKKPLDELIHDLEKEMLRLGCSQGTMQFYRRRWQMLLQFAQDQGETYDTERLGIEFIEKNFQILEKTSIERYRSQRHKNYVLSG